MMAPIGICLETSSSSVSSDSSSTGSSRSKDMADDQQFVQNLLIENCKLQYELVKLKKELTKQQRQQSQQPLLEDSGSFGEVKPEPDTTFKEVEEGNKEKQADSSLVVASKSPVNSQTKSPRKNTYDSSYTTADFNAQVVRFLSRQSDPTRSINRDSLGYGTGTGSIAEQPKRTSLFNSSVISRSTITGQKHRLSPNSSYEPDFGNGPDKSSPTSSMSSFTKIALLYDNNGEHALGHRRLSGLETLNRLNCAQDNIRSSAPYRPAEHHDELSIRMEKIKTGSHFQKSLDKTRRLKRERFAMDDSSSGSDQDDQTQQSEENQKSKSSSKSSLFERDSNCGDYLHIDHKILQQGRNSLILAEDDHLVVDEGDSAEDDDDYINDDESTTNKFLNHIQQHQWFVLPSEARQSSHLISFEQSTIDQNNIQKSFRAILDLWTQSRRSMSRLLFLYYVFDYLLEKYLKVDYCTTHNPPCPPQVNSTRFGTIAVPIVKTFLQSINRARPIIVQIEILSAIESLCYNKSRFRPAIAEIFDHLFSHGLVEATAFSEWSILDDFTVQHFPTTTGRTYTSSGSESETPITPQKKSNKSDKKSKSSKKNRTCSESAAPQSPNKMAETCSNRAKLLKELKRAGFTLLKKSNSVI